MKRLWMILGCAAAILPAAAAQAPGRQLAGRWNLTVTRGEVSYPSWMEVTEKDGKVEVRAQEREGSVHPVPSEMVDGRLVVKLTERPKNARVWEFTPASDGLTGVLKVGETVQAKVRALRAPALKGAAPAAWAAPESLFNGKDLTGWVTMNHTESQKATENRWVAKNGELVNEGKGHNIRTVRTFGDFKLHLEYNLEAASNSGIYLRGRYECQLPPPAPRTDGRPLYAIYGMVAAPVGVQAAAGEWHSYDITLVGRYVTLSIDGVKIVDNQEIAGITGGAIDSDEGAPGPIYFQGDHTGGIRFRNITIAAPKR